ncbi:MAG TPA: ribosome biogenesis GTP-binding protein YihA/YsxC [Longimicrobiales bacterium]|nr:ribosome biogenesis GTP-binding protein YihA/YsxC [Longimicrobiales bacterium]
MKIRTVEFAGAVAKPDGPIPGTLAQVAFAGRSNVGKSSLINRLLGRTRTPIARVSGSPGKTQEINFYHVDAFSEEDGADLEFFLVDLPGYGYARVPQAVRGAWKPLIEGYLGRSADLRGVVQLIDARRAPTPEDLTMIEFLAGLGTPTLVVPTKVDKLKRGERARQLESIASTLELDMDQIVPFSSRTGEGREVLLDALESLLREPTP